MKALYLVLALTLVTTLTACNDTANVMQDGTSQVVEITKHTTETVQETTEKAVDSAENAAEEAMGEIKDVAEAVSENFSATYADYDAEAAADQKHVLFFHATWCPTCVKWDKTVTTGLTDLSSNALIYKADFDTSDALKKQYNVTSHSTAVFINADGSVAKTEIAPSLESVNAFFAE